MKLTIAATCIAPLLGLASLTLTATTAKADVSMRCSEASLSAGLAPDIHLTHVAVVPRGPVLNPKSSPNGVPTTGTAIVGAHCLLQGAIEQRQGVGGKSYALKFELRVPEDWNGRLLYQGGGGLDGSVQPAMGSNISNGSTANVALVRGFAVVSTDSGHEGTDADFAEDQIAKINYAYAAIGKITNLARKLVVDVAGKLPDRTYFEGCSNGGREALIAAQRHAELFDGVVAGDPAFHLSAASVLANHAHQSYARIAPDGVDGKRVLAGALTDNDVAILSKAILDQCDGLDGAKDGMVFNHAECRFNPDVVECKAGQTDGCLPANKVEAIKAAFSGPKTATGTPLLPPYVYDAGVAGRNWRAWQIGIAKADGQIDSTLPDIIPDTLGRYFSYPQIGNAAVQKSDSASLLAAIAPSAAMTDATSTEFSSFAAKGGKFLIVTGWSDPIFSPNDLIAWYQQLGRDTHASGNGDAADFARLFLVPGMNHCGGGPSLDDFDALSTLVDWVEKNKAPDQFEATGKSFPGVSRPICAFPRKATYRGSGPLTASSSFVCK